MVCKSSRATSKRPFLMAIMALSKSSLSGCLDFTPSSGLALRSSFLSLLGFLPLAWAAIPPSSRTAKATAAIFVVTRFIPPHPAAARRQAARLILPVNQLLAVLSLARGLAGRSQQRARISLRLPRPKNSVAGHQQLRSCLDDALHRIVSHTAVHFDSKCQPQLLAQLHQSF